MSAPRQHGCAGCLAQYRKAFRMLIKCARILQAKKTAAAAQKASEETEGDPEDA